MKKQLLILSVAVVATMSFAVNASAQWEPKTVTINKVDVPPTIDGLNREWVDVPALDLDAPFNAEVVTMSEGAPTFKAVWNDTAVFVLVSVPDDDFYPAVEAGSTSTWLFDKPELYFDNNATILEVGEANCGAMHANSGHHQFAPSFGEAIASHSVWAYDASIVEGDASTAYFIEYSIGTAALTNRDAEPAVLADGLLMGFDVTVIDQDEDLAIDPINRVNWSNNCVDTRTDGVPGESWATLDASGEMTLSDVVIVLPTLGVNSVNFDNNAVYPTVANENLTVTFDATTAVIVNSVGQIVKKVNVIDNQIDVAGLPAGVYFVNLNTTEGVKTGKFLKR